MSAIASPELYAADRPICIHERDFVMQPQGFGGRREGNFDQGYVQIADPKRGISVTNDSVRMRGDKVFNVRHTHVFSQVRYFMRGVMTFGKDEVRAGDVQFVGDAVTYGPMNSTNVPEPLHFLQTQFTGPAGRLYLDKTRIPGVQAELSKTGVFDDGIYRPNGGRPMDSFEAITIAMEENNFALTGNERIKYPPKQLMHPVYVHTPNLPWRRYAEGISIKHVMYMFDTGPNVKLVRMTKGAVLPGGHAGFQQTRWLIEGSITWQGTGFECLCTMFYPPDMDYPETRSNQDGTTLLVIQWTNPGFPEIPYSQL